MSGPDIDVSPESKLATGVGMLGSGGLHEFIRYFAASLLALIVDAGVLWLLTSVVGVSYIISGAISFVLGLILVYVLSITWVFDSRAVNSRVAEFGVFLLIGLVGLAINEGVLWLATDVLGLYYLMSKLLSVILVFSWNFGARKYTLFR